MIQVGLEPAIPELGDYIAPLTTTPPRHLYVQKDSYISLTRKGFVHHWSFLLRLAESLDNDDDDDDDEFILL